MRQAAEQIFRVRPDQVHQTLAATLRAWLPKCSWREIQRLVARRQVMINGNVCIDAARRLKLQDVVKLLGQPMAAPPQAEDVRIRYHDEQVLVVEKPAGVTSNRHREERAWPARRKQLQPTLDELLPETLARLECKRSRRKRQPPPVRPVHRLDRDTSGLMVFARTVPAERILAEQFRQHTTHRKYLAIVHGNVAAQTFDSRLVRDRGDGRRGSTDNAHLGKHAVTHVAPREHLGDYTLIECQLETGRTHQIRIHLSEAGHPVCGDRLYDRAKYGHVREDHSGAPRLALHAAELGFVHPATGEPMHFEAPLPDDLRTFVEQLRRQTSRRRD